MMPGTMSRFCAVVPASSTSPPASTTVERYGSTTIPRPSSCATTIRSTPPPPNPPFVSAKGTPSNPISANLLQTLSLQPFGEARIPFRCSNEYSLATNRAIASRRSCCSSVREKSIVLEPEHVLRDDVPLDLVRAAVDRGLAPAEVARRERRGVLGRERRRGAALLDHRARERLRVRAERFHHELGERLLDLGALDFEDRGFRAGLVARREHPEQRGLERKELDLGFRELRAEDRVGGERLAALQLVPRDPLELRELAFRGANAGDAGALVTEQELRVGPALALLADEILGGHRDIVEEDLVHLVLLVVEHEWPHRDPRRVHVDEQEADAFLLLHRAVGAHQAEDQVGEVRERRPGFLAVDDVAVPLAHRARLQRGEVGAGAGLGVTLAPPVLVVADAREIVLLLPGAAVLHDHGSDHVDPEGDESRRAGGGALLVEDVVLDRRPLEPTVGLRPVADEPPLPR